MINPELPLGRRAVDAFARSRLLEPLADVLQPPLRALRDADPRVKDLLSGTPLGHALHPILTDVPVGAFTALAVLDVAAYRRPELADAADLVLATGIAGGLAAAVAGWSDWSDTSEGARRLGLGHALLNAGALLGYSASFALRRAGRRTAGIAAAAASYACLGLASYLGGELSTGMQLGSKHTAEPLRPSDEFVDVAADADVREGELVAANAGDIPVMLMRIDGTVSALGAACTHRGAPLAEGTIEDGCVRCPWHGSRFAPDGSVREGPATFPQPPFEVRVSGGRVAVRSARVFA